MIEAPNSWIDNKSQIRVRPFLKWAGGKVQIINKIRQTLPSGTRLVEPFVGSGAVFLNSDYDKFLISDINLDFSHFPEY